MELLSGLIKTNKVDHCVYEEVHAAKQFDPKTKTTKYNIDVVKKLAKTQGAVEEISCMKHISFELFPVNEWRSYLPLKFTSKKPKREEIKKAVCDYIDSTFPELKNEIEDVKEAVAMGMAWVAKQNKLMESDKQRKS